MFCRVEKLIFGMNVLLCYVIQLYSWFLLIKQQKLYKITKGIILMGKNIEHIDNQCYHVNIILKKFLCIFYR